MVLIILYFEENLCPYRNGARIFFFFFIVIYRRNGDEVNRRLEVTTVGHIEYTQGNTSHSRWLPKSLIN